MKHQDSRRTLYEFEYPITKLLVMHEDAEVGNHYHLKKDEEFMLVSGEGTLNGKDMMLFESHLIKAGTPHTFNLKKDSVLLGFCTRPYDPTDDYDSPR